MAFEMQERVKQDTLQLNWAHWISGQIGIVPVSYGVPGLAKTLSHSLIARLLERYFAAVALGQESVEDIGGYPVPVTEEINGQTISFIRKTMLEPIAQCHVQPSVLLLDEFGSTSEAKQAAALKIVLEGISGCMIFAAGNPPDFAAYGQELASPMINRVLFRTWEFDVKAHQEGSRHEQVYPDPVIPIVADGWTRNLAYWGSLKADFIDVYPDALISPPKGNRANDENQPWASPRSWTNMERYCAAAMSVGAKKSVIDEGMDGLLGQDVAEMFRGHIAKQDLTDPAVVLRDPTSHRLRDRGDLVRAELAAMSNYLRLNQDADLWEAARDWVEFNYHGNREWIHMWLGNLYEAKPENYAPPTRPGVWRELVNDRMEIAEITV